MNTLTPWVLGDPCFKCQAIFEIYISTKPKDVIVGYAFTKNS